MDQLKKLLFSLSPRQRWTILIAAIVVGAGIYSFSQYQRKSGMRPLYNSLSAEDAGAIVAKLRESGVEYTISDGGSSIYVPEAKVAELRLDMAGLGLPKTGRIGFEIFDKTNFGITDFAEHVNYRRAVEGELERSIMALAEVQQARVHVSLPKESVFLESREPAKASVLVGLKPGLRLSAQNVTAITNLISSAVEGLASESVSVVDMHGNLLSRPRRDSLNDGVQITEAAMEYRQALERDLTAKINNTLEPLLGSDKYRTGVSADVDMSSGEQSEETFDPSKSVMVTSQKTEDVSGNTRSTGATPGTPAGTAGGGTPGTTANLAPQTTPGKPNGNSTSTSRKTENITYQSSRLTKHTKLPQGSIRRLSIAVLVDQTVKWEQQGKQFKQVLTPPSPEKLKTIQTVVAALVGLNATRGDQLTVESLPFDTTLNTEPPAAVVEQQKQQQQTTKPTGNPMADLMKNKPVFFGIIAGVVLMLGVAGFGVFKMRKRKAAAKVQAALAAAAAVQTPAIVLPPVTDEVQLSAVAAQAFPALGPVRTEALLLQLQESGKNNPELWANILRGWLAEEQEAS